MNIFYRWLMSSKSHEFDRDIKDYIDIIEEYKLFTTEMLNDSIDVSDNKYYIFKNIVDDKISYNIFYENLHIRLEKSPKETVYSFHLKTQSDNWRFKRVDDKYDLSHPSNQTFRVFVSYDVPVLNITRANGYSYINGTWDKYLYKTINAFETTIKDCTDKVQFNNEYK